MQSVTLTREELASSPTTVFRRERKLGEGAYGEVYMATHVRTGKQVAIKILPIDKDMENALDAEINTMKDCDSEYIVQYYASYTQDENMWIVMEYCMAGAVSDIIELTGLCLSENHISQICKGVLHGLQYIHAKNRIHRDIKSGNILLNDVGDVKIADFGISGKLADASSKRTTVIGTPYWMAPEVIQEEGYGVLADIWSLGITCIELAEGLPPYHDLHPMKAIFMIPSRPSPTLEAPRHFSSEFNNFIARCLTKDPKKRPSAIELLQDPFIKRKVPRNTLLGLVNEVSKHLQNQVKEARDEDNRPQDFLNDNEIIQKDFELNQIDDSTLRRAPLRTIKRISTSLKTISVPDRKKTSTNTDEQILSPIGPISPKEPLKNIKEPVKNVKVPADIIGKCINREDFSLLYESLKYQFGLEIDRKDRDQIIKIQPIQEALYKKK